MKNSLQPKIYFEQNGEKRSLSAAEAKTLMNFDLMPEADLSKLQDSPVLKNAKSHGIDISVIDNTVEALLVKEIPEIKGYGLYASGTIPKDTIIGQYVGKHYLVTPETNICDPYTLYVHHNIPDEELQYGTFALMKQDGITYSSALPNAAEIYAQYSDRYIFEVADKRNFLMVSSEKQGGLLRFMNHLPDQDTHTNLTEIRRANVERIDIDKKVYYITTKEISKGEQIGFDYGSTYWDQTNYKPAFFSKHNDKVQNMDEAYNAEGLTAFKAKDYKRAINLFKTCNEIKPTLQVKYNLARSYQLNGQFSDAFQIYTSIRAKHPDKEKVYNQLFECCNKLPNKASDLIKFKQEFSEMKSPSKEG